MYSPKRHTTCPKKSYAQRAPKLGRKLKSLTFFTCRRWCFLRWKSASVYVIWLLFDFETLFRSFLQIRLMHYINAVIYEVLIALSNRTVLNCWKNVCFGKVNMPSISLLKTVEQRSAKQDGLKIKSPCWDRDKSWRFRLRYDRRQLLSEGSRSSERNWFQLHTAIRSHCWSTGKGNISPDVKTDSMLRIGDVMSPIRSI